MQAAIVDRSNMFRARLTFCLLLNGCNDLNVSVWAFRKLADSLQSSSYINLGSDQAIELDLITSLLMLNENEGKPISLHLTCYFEYF